jgi:hypothetical protein
MELIHHQVEGLVMPLRRQLRRKNLTKSGIDRFLVCQKPYRCKICRATFSSASCFVDHVLDIHFPNDKYSLWARCQLSREARELNEYAIY